MNISPWSDTPFDDPDAFADFLMVHGLSHDRIAQVMYANSDNYTVYPLYDSPHDNHDWALTHYSEHQSIFELLDLTGLPDLASVNFDDEEEFETWMQLHQQVHERINTELGIV